MEEDSRGEWDSFLKYQKLIYKIAYGFLKDHEDAIDICNDVWVEYLEEIKNEKNFITEEYRKNWILCVTKNICKNKLAKKIRIEHEKENSIIKEENPHKSYLVDRIYEEIELLENKYKVPFELFYKEDKKIKEISQILNIKEDAVKKRLSRSRKYIREKISNT